MTFKSIKNFSKKLKKKVQEKYWTYVMYIFLIIFLQVTLPFFPLRFSLRIAFSYLLTSILEPQDPEWNPIIEEFRTQFPNSSLFFTYGTAKKTTHRITWGIIFLFACVHLIRPNS